MKIVIQPLVTRSFPRKYLKLIVVARLEQHRIDKVECPNTGLPRDVLRFVHQIAGHVQSDAIVEQATTGQIQRVVDQLGSVRGCDRGELPFVQQMGHDQCPVALVVVDPVVACGEGCRLDFPLFYFLLIRVSGVGFNLPVC